MFIGKGTERPKKSLHIVQKSNENTYLSVKLSKVILSTNPLQQCAVIVIETT